MAGIRSSRWRANRAGLHAPNAVSRLPHFHSRGEVLERLTVGRPCCSALGHALLVARSRRPHPLHLGDTIHCMKSGLFSWS